MTSSPMTVCRSTSPPSSLSNLSRPSLCKVSSWTPGLSISQKVPSMGLLAASPRTTSTPCTSSPSWTAAWNHIVKPSMWSSPKAWRTGLSYEVSPFSVGFVDGQCKALILQSILGMLHVLVPRQNNLWTFEPVFFFDLRVVPFLILHSTYQNYWYLVNLCEPQISLSGSEGRWSPRRRRCLQHDCIFSVCSMQLQQAWQAGVLSLWVN